MCNDMSPSEILFPNELAIKIFSLNNLSKINSDIPIEGINLILGSTNP